MAGATVNSSRLVDVPPPVLAPENPVYTVNDYLRARFGQRVYKVTLDAGFTCPNRDGSLAFGGCTFCNNAGFSPNSVGPRRSIEEQLARGIAFVRHRFKARKFIPYFQAYTNTYGPVEHLRRLYDRVAFHPEVVGLAIGTRPDCVNGEILDLIESYASPEREVWLEYGLQSAHDETLRRVNRGHDVAAFETAMALTTGRAIRVIVHVIFGLPGEDRSMMLETIDYLRQFDIHGLKLHVLHILPQTVMEREYREGAIRLLELEEYVELACDALERLLPTVVVHRLSADSPPEMLIAPKWCGERALVRTRILSEFVRRGTYQGARLRGTETTPVAEQGKTGSGRVLTSA